MFKYDDLSVGCSELRTIAEAAQKGKRSLLLLQERAAERGLPNGGMPNVSIVVSHPWSPNRGLPASRSWSGCGLESVVAEMRLPGCGLPTVASQC